MGLFGNLFGGAKLKKASKKAYTAQKEAFNKGIGQQETGFQYIQDTLAPWQSAGLDSLSAYKNLVGLGGAENQAAAIAQLKASPYYQSLYRTGEESVLQNASATGGLRGGNTQASLYELGEDTLSRTIQQQLGNLGGLTEMGYGTAGQLAGYNQAMNDNITEMLLGKGQAKAQDILTRGALSNQMWSGFGGLALGAAGTALGMPGFGSFTKGSPLGNLFGTKG